MRLHDKPGPLAHRSGHAAIQAVLITAIVYALIGLVLAAGGIWLAALGGSIFYIVLGVGVLATAALLLMQRRSALWLFAIVLVGTLAWAVHEVRLDWWPLAARGDIIFRWHSGC